MKPVDAVTIGVGWTGGIIARELTKAGLSVVGLERGEFRATVPDFLQPAIHDELAYVSRNKLFQNPATDAMTFRNNVRETALPMRQFTAFLPGDGLGGGSVHWTGRTWRFLEYDFTIRSSSIAKYGPAIMGEDCTSQDWGITYHDLEPDYDRFEYLAGISGKAGNINGKKIPGAQRVRGSASPRLPQSAAHAVVLARAVPHGDQRTRLASVHGAGSERVATVQEQRRRADGCLFLLRLLRSLRLLQFVEKLAANGAIAGAARRTEVRVTLQRESPEDQPRFDRHEGDRRHLHRRRRQRGRPACRRWSSSPPFS